MKMSSAFRLGYKLGRLHGKVQYAEQGAQVWNGYVAQLNEANQRAAENYESLHSEAVYNLDHALAEHGVTVNDLDEANLTPATWKDRRKLKRQQAAWARQQGEDSIPLP